MCMKLEEECLQMYAKSKEGVIRTVFNDKNGCDILGDR